ncbi:MAG: class I SAM-dependent methyltransferase [Smithella sp.]|nr:class I SAM-dependent methyltransferase [Smithella sp.]
MSTGKIYLSATVEEVLKRLKTREGEFLHLDIGSGTGELVRLFKTRLKTRSFCCDYSNELMKLPGQPVDMVDLNVDKKLPYQDNMFDIVTATEVVEHLEDFRAILREIYRVLKPGGICVLTTPNILNINSRLRNLWFGFADLMGPLPVQNRKKESCFGHINPLSLFYLIHAMREMDFRDIALAVDKYQRSGMVKLVFWWLPIRLFGMSLFRRETCKYKTIDDSNRNIIRQINSLPVLLGRTIILSAVKK